MPRDTDGAICRDKHTDSLGKMQKTIIFSDLDGTLLDETNYGFDAALPTLNLLRARAIPLIFCSSKTRVEIDVYRSRMHNAHPFVSENGGGIFIPQGYFSAPFEAETRDGYRTISLGLPYREIRSRFVALRERFGAQVRGFGDMTVEEVVDLTGLSREEAVLAKQRDFDEPFVFDGAPDPRFLQAIQDAGLHWTQGRIFHMLGQHDKGHAVRILTAIYRQEFGALASIGLGDGFNDSPLLLEVDHPILIRHEDGSYDSRVNMAGLIRTRSSGPRGWSEAVEQLLSTNRKTPGALLKNMYSAALEAVDPYQAVLRAAKLGDGCLNVAGAEYRLADVDHVVVVGAGKASSRMAQAVEALLNERISAGLIVVKVGHKAKLGVIGQIEADHPVPNEAGAEATQCILEMLRTCDEKTLVICLLSGGASALLVAPVDGVTLGDKQEVTALLLKAGAAIGELNAVRKHLSAVKGGRLAQAAYPARVLTLILSDVIGDRIDVIASGPTAPDGSRFGDAWAVIEKYGLEKRIPARTRDYLLRGCAGFEPETLKDGEPCLHGSHNVIVGGIALALAAARKKSAQLGLAAEIVTSELQGEARDAARSLAHAARIRQAGLRVGQRQCLLFGGETTVTVRGSGKGGRNQELALAFALEIEGRPGIFLLSAGTDGNDGPTEAAGALVDGETAERARRLGMDPVAYLEANDSYGLFHCLDTMSEERSHFITGPTGTNVMDIQIILLEGVDADHAGANHDGKPGEISRQ
jgi:glycerate 2-kinase